MIAVTQNTIRKILGSYLFGLGLANFFSYIFLNQYWIAKGSHVQDAAHGLVYRHVSKGTVAYLSRFQDLSETLLLMSIFVLVLAGSALAPRTWERKLYGPIWRWVQKPEYDVTARNGLIAGFVSSPIFVYFVGPTIVFWAMSLASLV